MAEYDDYLLRPMTIDDMQTVFDWRQQDHISKVMFSDLPISLKEHRVWFEKTLQDDSVDYQILEFQGKPVGLANAVSFDPERQQCYWGFYIGALDAPKGSGTIMGNLMLQHIFRQHPVTHITGEAFAFNTASLKLHRKLGFVERPELSHSVDKQGKHEPVIVMTLDKDQYDT